MLTVIQAILNEIFILFIQMAPYLLFGFIVSGFLYVLIPRSLIIKHLKPNKTSSIFKAAIMGVPLPLCSCGVIPVAAHLRKQGANKSATVSFLASTPSTGADSILATYSLMGPIYAIFRPIDALFSGLLAGLLVKMFNADENDDPVKQPSTSKATTFTAAPKASMLTKQAPASFSLMPKLATATTSCCSSDAVVEVKSSCCSNDAVVEEETSCCSSDAAVEEETPCCSNDAVVEEKQSCCSNSAVVEEKQPCCSNSAVVEEETSCCSSSAVVEEKQSCCSSDAVVEEETSCCSSSAVVEEKQSCCSSDAVVEAKSSCCSEVVEETVELSMSEKIKKAISYGLFELVDDTKKWILIGIVIGGVLSWGIPSELADYWIAYPALSYLSMLLIGLPMYVCATASIPIATAMLMNGLSPGAALVFLAVGPATNTATMAFLSSTMGKKNMFIYVFSISFSAIVLGIIIDLFFGSQLKDYFQSSTEMIHIGVFDYVLSAILAGLILFQYVKKPIQ